MANPIPTDSERKIAWRALLREINRFGYDDPPEKRLALYVVRRREGVSHEDALDSALNASVDEVRPYGMAPR